jgi:hypothetical protein
MECCALLGRVDPEQVFTDAEIVDSLSDAEKRSDDQDTAATAFEEGAISFFTHNFHHGVTNAVIARDFRSGDPTGLMEAACDTSSFSLATRVEEC